MTLKNPRLWIGVCSAVVVLSLAIVDFGRTSPGPLAAVHERVSDLSGRTGCSDCHGGWGTSMTSACLECHAVIDTQIEYGDGLHGAIEQRKAMRCAWCHSEHHGSSFALVNVQSFLRAGSPERGEFEHEIVGFPMDGRHLEIECSDCHENADVPVLEKGSVRFLGLDKDCTTCHEDHHEGRFVLECAKCHGQTEWDSLASLGHEEHLPLIGGHAEIDCFECHDGGRRSMDLLGTSQRGLLRARACMDCHESPHDRDFIDRIALLSTTPVEATCVQCHEPEHTSFADGLPTVTHEQHARTGFPLDVPHDVVECDDCHWPELVDFLDAYPGRRPDECSICHADPHDGQFEEGAFAGQECTACHAKEFFEPHEFTAATHDETGLPLTGSHLEADCDACHDRPHENAPRVFGGMGADCDSCHADAHQGFFDEIALDYEEIEHGECARCHLETDFSEFTEGFDHAEWGGFGIEGAHTQSGCDACHPSTEEPDEYGRTFGWVDEHFGRFVGCVTCHVDPHGGEFDAPGLPRKLNGERGCARCHDQTSFRSFPDGFDHGRWTGFLLQGAHGEIDCSDCHAPLHTPDELGRTWARAFGRQCSDCHSDPHAGQFERAGTTNCRRCHTRATAFSDLSFNHEWDSRFPLGEAHEEVDCSLCHFPVTVGDDEIVRYRPLGRECVDCHGEQEEPLRRRRRKN